MSPFKTSLNNENGFLLIGVIAMMLILGITAVAVNREAGMNIKIAANRKQSEQNYFGQLACMEEALWQLTQDPNWHPSRHTDLTFHKNIHVPDKIITAGGDFEVDGFAAGQKIAVMYAAGDNEGIHDVLSVSGNTIEVPAKTLKDASGSGVIQRLSSPPMTHTVSFARGGGGLCQ
jgi:hypothetical protein